MYVFLCAGVFVVFEYVADGVVYVFGVCVESWVFCEFVYGFDDFVDSVDGLLDDF